MQPVVAPALASGSPLEELEGPGRGRLAAFVVEASGRLLGLTTHLIAARPGGILVSDLREVGAVKAWAAAEDAVAPITSCLGFISPPETLRMDAGFGRVPYVGEPLSRYTSLDAQVQVIRSQGPASFGRVVSAGGAVRLLHRGSGVERTYTQVLAVRPDTDRSPFAQRGDGGALVVTANGGIAGVYIGSAEGLFYVAPIDEFFAQHGLRLATPDDLPQSERPSKRISAVKLDDEMKRFRKDIRKAESRAKCLRVAEDTVARLVLLSPGRNLDLRSIWQAFDVPDDLRAAPAENLRAAAGDKRPEAERYRLARAYVLREWRRLGAPKDLADDQTAAAAFESQIGFDGGAWSRATDLIEDIRRQFDTIPRPRGSKEAGQLLIAYSGYHEERILADVISRLCMAELNTPTIEKSLSPYVFSRRLADATGRRINRSPTGGADVRLVNVVAGVPGDNEDLAEEPVLQHFGYRAYARGSWLRRLRGHDKAPEAVRAWIDQALEGKASLLPETQAARCWILAAGGPHLYRDTEFSDLFDYIWEHAATLQAGVPQKPTLSPRPSARELQKSIERGPDQVFEDFIMGKSHVLMSGSIHDVLIDDWLGPGDDILELLVAEDFQELRRSTAGALGTNALLLSKRVSQHPALPGLLTALYRVVWHQLVARLKDPTTRDGMARYLANLLAPRPSGEWYWSFAADDDGIIRLLTEEVREVEEEVPTPRLYVVQGGAA